MVKNLVKVSSREPLGKNHGCPRGGSAAHAPGPEQSTTRRPRVEHQEDRLPWSGRGHRQPPLFPRSGVVGEQRGRQDCSEESSGKTAAKMAGEDSVEDGLGKNCGGLHRRADSSEGGGGERSRRPRSFPSIPHLCFLVGRPTCGIRRPPLAVWSVAPAPAPLTRMTRHILSSVRLGASVSGSSQFAPFSSVFSNKMIDHP